MGVGVFNGGREGRRDREIARSGRRMGTEREDRGSKEKERGRERDMEKQDIENRE